MTITDDGNPSPHAPRLPTDPPPRRPAAGDAQTDAEGVAAPTRTPADAPSKSSDRGHATTNGDGFDAAAVAADHRRALVHAILATIPPAMLPLAVFAVRLWCRAIAAATELAADAAALPRAPDLAVDVVAERCADKFSRELVTGAVTAAADALYGSVAGVYARAFELLSVAWFGATPYNVDPARCAGLPAAALADLEAFERVGIGTAESIEEHHRGSAARRILRINGPCTCEAGHPCAAAGRRPSERERLLHAALGALPPRRARCAARRALTFLELASAVDAIDASMEADGPDRREMLKAAEVLIHHARAYVRRGRPSSARAAETLITAACGEGAAAIAGMVDVVNPILPRGSRRGIAVLRALSRPT